MAVLTPYQSAHDEDHIMHSLCINVPAFASGIASICRRYDYKGWILCPSFSIEDQAGLAQALWWLTLWSHMTGLIQSKATLHQSINSEE